MSAPKVEVYQHELECFSENAKQASGHVATALALFARYKGIADGSSEQADELGDRIIDALGEAHHQLEGAICGLELAPGNAQGATNAAR